MIFPKLEKNVSRVREFLIPLQFLGGKCRFFPLNWIFSIHSRGMAGKTFGLVKIFLSCVKLLAFPVNSKYTENSVKNQRFIRFSMFATQKKLPIYYTKKNLHQIFHKIGTEKLYIWQTNL